MTRVMIAVDGSDLDAPLAATTRRLFGPDADYWAVNVNPGIASATAAAATTIPAMYGGSLVGFGGAYPYVAPYPYQVRGDDGEVVDRAEIPVLVISRDAADRPVDDQGTL